jgi:hypothetical protein
MTEDDVLGSFLVAIRNVASVSLAIEYPTIVSVNHSLVNSYKKGSDEVIFPTSVSTDVLCF